MSWPSPPAVTVHFGGWQRTFAPGVDVVIGRDVRADIRLPHPAVSRAHVVLRYVDGRWIVIDNHSMNGIFVADRRVSSVQIRNWQTIHLGNPEGPPVSFELARPAPPADPPTTRLPRDSDAKTDVVTIGRSSESDIVIPDVLASAHHAVLVTTPEGARLTDTGSVNGTFVNGQSVEEVVLRDTDVVTIGNLDLVYADGRLVRRTEPDARTDGLEVCNVSLTIDGNHTLLDRVSFSAKQATLTAVIGPSGSGKSTLSNVIAGGKRPTTGSVTFEGHHLHAEYAALRSRIGMVPQDDVVHRQLTVNQALGYAAELRMPPDTTKDDRSHVIAQVLEELELTAHANTRIDRLSGGQRKRASVALELLTGPSLLVLDEPTTGLDPALDLAVMTMLRALADAGRVVVVVTHSLSFLDICDQVLVLAPGGRAVYCGPPSQVGQAMGSTDWADIYTEIGADPVGAQKRFLERAGQPAKPPARSVPDVPAALGKPAHSGPWRQFSAVARRQMRLIVADRGYFVFLVLLPILVGLLPLAVAGDTGFGRAAVDSAAPNEPKQILVMLNLGAVFMGTALTIRELVAERAIFRREQAVGLSTTAYLAAKIAVFGAAAAIQSAVLVLIVTAPKIGKGAPTSAVVLGSPRLELFADIAATCVVAAIVGLAVSSLAQNSNQVLPLMVAAVMTQLVLAGGFIPVTDRMLDPVSWLTPSRWGLAATASTADLTHTVAVIPHDSHWKHTASAWPFDVAMLGVLAVAYTGFVRWKIRLTSR